jgi:hypothetical protein
MIDLDNQGMIYFRTNASKASGSNTTITNRATLSDNDFAISTTITAKAHNIVQEGSGYYTTSGTTTGYGYVERKACKSGSSHISFDAGCYPKAGMNDVYGVMVKPIWSLLTSGGSVRKVYGVYINPVCAPAGSQYSKVAATSGLYMALSNQSGRRIRQIECLGNAVSDIPSVQLRSLSLKSADYFNAALTASPDKDSDSANFAAENLHVPATAVEVGTGIYMNETGSMCFARNGECVLEIGNGKVIGNLLDKLEAMESRIQQLEKAAS